MRVPELDGIRGIAIAMVLACHIVSLAFGANPPVLFKPLYHVMTAGWLGVDVFFVLSGFLITTNILKERDKPQFWSDFYRRRAFRILPAYVLVVLVCLAIFPPNLVNKSSVFLILFFAANWTITGLVGSYEMPYFTHLWSLGIEEQFYFIWPQVAARMRPINVFRTAMAVAVFSNFARILLAHQEANSWIVYKITPSRLDAISLGAALAAAFHCPQILSFLQKTWLLVLLGGLAGLLLAVARGHLNLNPGSLEAQIYGIPSAAIIVAMTIFAAQTNRLPITIKLLLKSGALGYLGKRSFSLYLINTPVVFALEHFVSHVESGRLINSWLMPFGLVLGGLSLSIALSELSYRFVELPAQEFGRNLRLSVVPTTVTSGH